MSNRPSAFDYSRLMTVYPQRKGHRGGERCVAETLALKEITNHKYSARRTGGWLLVAFGIAVLTMRRESNEN